ncbi:MAG: SigE family RNA polymerase sigma factor [Pseudonocardiales bacterium]|nr:MAG: SigE family RNA polymerase sigma factor [Pseudonocardiales bacterium]
MDADEAVADLVRASGDQLVRFAFQLCHDRATAEDLVQASLERVYRRWSVRGPVEWPEAYARRAVVNEFLGRRRGAVSKELLMAVPPDRLIPDATDAVLDREPLWRALEQLPPRQRAALVLRYYDDVADSQIAKLLGCREATVRSLIARGLKHLRGIFADTNEAQQVNPR